MDKRCGEGEPRLGDCQAGPKPGVTQLSALRQTCISRSHIAIMPRSSLRSATLDELLQLTRSAEKVSPTGDDPTTADDSGESDDDDDGMQHVPLLNRRASDDGGRTPHRQEEAPHFGQAAAPLPSSRHVGGSPSLDMLRRWQTYTSSSSSEEEDEGDNEPVPRPTSAEPPRRAAGQTPPRPLVPVEDVEAHPLVMLARTPQSSSKRRQESLDQQPMLTAYKAVSTAARSRHSAEEESLVESLDRALLAFLTTSAEEEDNVGWHSDGEVRRASTAHSADHATTRTAQLVDALGEMYGSMLSSSPLKGNAVADFVLTQALGSGQLQSVRVAQEYALWAAQQDALMSKRFT
jgi:hypothetical protein